MRIALFCPYGNSSGAELIPANFIFLLASYLQQRKVDVSALKCDGCLDRCTLDRFQLNRKRPCLQCMNSQKALVNWSNVPSHAFSSFLGADDLKKINQHFSNTNFLKDTLPNSGFSLLQEYLELHAENSEQITKIQKTSLSLALAIKKFIIEIKPKLLLTHTAKDLLTGMVALSFADHGLTIATYESSAIEDELRLVTNKHKEVLRFGFYSSHIEHFRSDPATWDDKLRDAIVQNVSFLGLQSSQLSFHI